MYVLHTYIHIRLLCPALLAGALSDDAVCRVHGEFTGEQKPGKTKIGTPVAHVTRDSDTTFRVKGQLAGAWEYCGRLTYNVNIH